MPVALPPEDPSPQGAGARPTGEPHPHGEQPVGAQLRGYGSAAGLGLQCAASLVFCTLAGTWLDRRLSTRPWLMLIGIALGLVGCFVLIVRTGQASRATGASQAGAPGPSSPEPGSHTPQNPGSRRGP